jgi:RNA polymerase sigma factor (TIGR02999 family)
MIGTRTYNTPTMGEITQLLGLARQGDAEAQKSFFAQIHCELQRLANYHLEKQSPLTLIDGPALVREAYLRISKQEILPGRDRNAFLAYASQAMRSVIVDYIRSRKAQRNRHQSITLTTNMVAQELQEPQIERLINCLEELASIDERAHRVVEMRFFGGMDIPEIADVLNISVATVQRDWTRARAYLFHAINESGNT